jgi:uncharacterized protein (TIGR03435 family)
MFPFVWTAPNKKASEFIGIPTSPAATPYVNIDATGPTRMKMNGPGFRETIVFLVVVTPWVMLAQPSSFEAASIHALTPPFRSLKQLKISGTFVTLEGYNFRWLVSEAFEVKDYQVSTDTVPRSAQEVLYRIDARAGGQSAPRKADVSLMLQALLKDRFHLAIHREIRKMPVYALVLDKNGPALKPGSDVGECSNRIGPTRPHDRNYRYEYSNCTLDTLVEALSADRPILDRTGLTGRYDFEIVATPEFMMRDSSEPGDIRFLDAVRKLGLRLEAQNVPVEMIVIDHIDSAPSPN